MNENCKHGNHNLQVIQKMSVGYDEYQVVRWCNQCGAIVVDGEYDGRTAPGMIMKMKSPNQNS